ncbi:hypothetical protein BDV18DRAFT_143361 [Aspergillus unguis]
MLIDGEKWACEACVRGHRVSSCHHNDRPLTHINKKGRPVSQCQHCRGLRKSRTTHTKCECGDKKKNSHRNDLDPHAVEKRDLKQDSHSRCGCIHGQRCTCALKKEPHLDTVPEIGIPPPAAPPLEQPRKPQLMSTKSESTLTVFRDGHHKPAHKHNDMAHKCGLPYTIPRSHTIHAAPDTARRSVDHLPLAQSSFMGEAIAHQPRERPGSIYGFHRRVKSEHGSPENNPVVPPGDDSTSVPPLDLSSLFSHSQPMEDLNASAAPATIPMSMPKTSLEPIETNGLPFSLPFSTFPTSNASPVSALPFQDSCQPEPFFTSPENDLAFCSAGLNVAPVDWSSVPLSSAMPTTSTQPPSYASFDYNPMGPGMPAPSSSGDVSELEDFAPLPHLGHNDHHDLTSVSDGSDVDHYRISSASSFISLPQAQMLASNNLESISVDDFLQQPANEPTTLLDQQLQVSMGMEPKGLPNGVYSMPETQAFDKSMISPETTMPMTTTATEPFWPAALFDPSSVPLDDPNFFAPPAWGQ